MQKPIVALQMWTVRDYAAQDLPGTLRQLKEMGYDAVELAGTYGLETDAFREMLDKAGLVAVSTHAGMHEFREDAAAAVARYKQLGCHMLGIPGVGNDALPGGERFEWFLAQLNMLGQLCNDLEMPLMYHNHDHEFKTLPDGRYVLDALFESIPAQYLQAEIDAGWVLAAGLDPVPYIQKYADRCPVIHLKDLVKAGDKFEDRPVGQGGLDIPAVIKAALDGGCKILVAELDFAPPGVTLMDAAQKSREYLSSIGY